MLIYKNQRYKNCFFQFISISKLLVSVETKALLHCLNTKRMHISDNIPVILFDGYCKLCNRAVNFVIKHGGRNKFRFASLQSDSGKSLLSGFLINKQNIDSIVYIEDKKTFYRSTAILRIIKRLGKAWSILYIFIIVPPFIRDWVYDIVAGNRYRWFGRNESCRINHLD